MRFILMAFFITVLIASCTPEKDIYNGKFIISGKWIATQRWSSPGNGGSWYNLPLAEKFTVEFKADSSFSYSANFPKADSLFNRYSISGNSVIMSSSLNNKQDVWYYFNDSSSTPNQMSLSIFRCIEGCSYRLERK